MAGRKTKLTTPVQDKIIKMLKTGVSVTDACANVGISTSTFYDWLGRGEAGELPFSEFSSAVSRAFSDAKVTAIGTIRGAMSPYTQKTVKTETYTETRVVKDKAGNPVLDEDGQPQTFEYVEKTVTKTETTFQGEWRAAADYLKRRFPLEWGDRLQVEDWRTPLSELIELGLLDRETAERELGLTLAEELFNGATVGSTPGREG